MKELLPLKIDALYIYPIKSCAGVRVAQLRFNEIGLIDGDREWVVVNAQSDVVWQGSHPRLALVRPEILDKLLVLRQPNLPSVFIDRFDISQTTGVHIWNDITKCVETYPGFDAGAPAAAFLRRITGADLRLVRLGAQAIARNSVKPVHVSTTPSLHELNQALQLRSQPVVQIERFRPNVVVNGLGAPLQPFLEDQFDHLVWTSPREATGGNSAGEISISGKCVRCIVPNVDPQTAEVGEEPSITVAALSAQRFAGEASYFGVYGHLSQGHGTSLSEHSVLAASLIF